MTLYLFEAYSRHAICSVNIFFSAKAIQQYTPEEGKDNGRKITYLFTNATHQRGEREKKIEKEREKIYVCYYYLCVCDSKNKKQIVKGHDTLSAVSQQALWSPAVRS